MTQQRPGNIANLKAATARRHQDAVTRAEAGLQKLTRSGQQVTFRGVAKAAGVSLEFLYNHPQLRSRIEHLRAQQQTTAAPARPAADPGAPSVVRRKAGLSTLPTAFLGSCLRTWTAAAILIFVRSCAGRLDPPLCQVDSMAHNHYSSHTSQRLG